MSPAVIAMVGQTIALLLPKIVEVVLEMMDEGKDTVTADDLQRLYPRSRAEIRAEVDAAIEGASG